MEKKIISGVPKKELRLLVPGIFLGLGVINLFLSLVTSAEEMYLAIAGGFIIIAALAYLYMSRCEISVTDKRVYGTAAFGKRVDLPIDSISAVGMSFLNGISVATSSGKVSFFCIENYTEVHKAISELLLLRQENKGISSNQVGPQSDADELMKYKQLKDNGVISEEEFDAKKKQLLGM